MPSPSLLRPALAVLTMVVLAVGAAVVVAVRSGDDASVVRDSGLKLTAAQTEGRALFAERCGSCHTLSATNSVGKVGPDFDVLAPNGLDEEFVEITIANGMARGNGTMPKGIVDGPDAEDVASFLSAVTRDEAAGRQGR